MIRIRRGFEELCEYVVKAVVGVARKQQRRRWLGPGPSISTLDWLLTTHLGHGHNTPCLPA